MGVDVAPEDGTGGRHLGVIRSSCVRVTVDHLFAYDLNDVTTLCQAPGRCCSHSRTSGL